MGLSRMVDHIKPLLRPNSDQQFSHSLGTKPTISLSFTQSSNSIGSVNFLLWLKLPIHPLQDPSQIFPKLMFMQISLNLPRPAFRVAKQGATMG